MGAPVTKPQATAPVTKPQATAPVTKPEATAERSGPPTELSKLSKRNSRLEVVDDRVAVLQRKLADTEEKLHDLLQTSLFPNSDPKLKKLTRLIARIKKKLTTLHLGHYQARHSIHLG